MNKYLLIGFLLVQTFLISSFISPTAQYVLRYPLEEIKYNLRLDGANFEQKPIFDKAIAQETLGFAGYFAASSEFRMYQDIIRMIFEEKLAINIPADFHFLAVPLYPERTIKSVEAVYKEYYEKNHAGFAKHDLFPVTLSLYSNHKSIGFCPAKNFAVQSPYKRVKDLEWLVTTLGLDEDLVERAEAIRKRYFIDEDRVLIQIFDMSQISYALIDPISYPASYSGHPFKNKALSDYVLESDIELPPQFYIVLDDATILNPQMPFVVKRYTKGNMKKYEDELRLVVKASALDSVEAANYYKQLQEEWNR